MFACTALHFVGTLALGLVEDDLAHAHALGRHLHVLVLLDVFEGLLEREDDGRMMRALLSEPDARMLVSFFDLVTLMTRSFSCTCSPTTCPA